MNEPMISLDTDEAGPARRRFAAPEPRAPSSAGRPSAARRPLGLSWRTMLRSAVRIG